MEGDRGGAGHALRSVDQLCRDPRRHPGDRPLHRPVAHRRLRADRSESRARGRRLPRGLRHGLHHRGGDRSAGAAIRRREKFSQHRQAVGLFPPPDLARRHFSAHPRSELPVDPRSLRVLPAVGRVAHADEGSQRQSAALRGDRHRLRAHPRDRADDDLATQRARGCGHLAFRLAVHLAFSIFVTVICPLTRSASNLTLSPTFTCLSIAGSCTRKTIVIPSFMSSFLIGPCLSVILPAASSILVTWPLTMGDWPRVTVANVNERMRMLTAARAILRMVLLLLFSLARLTSQLSGRTCPSHSGRE